MDPKACNYDTLHWAVPETVHEENHQKESNMKLSLSERSSVRQQPLQGEQTGNTYLLTVGAKPKGKNCTKEDQKEIESGKDVDLATLSDDERLSIHNGGCNSLKENDSISSSVKRNDTLSLSEENENEHIYFQLEDGKRESEHRERKTLPKDKTSVTDYEIFVPSK